MKHNPKTYQDIDKNGFGDWAINEAQEAKQNIEETIEKLDKEFEETKAELIDFANDSKVIFKHRKQILNLPTMILEGEVNNIESFLDTVVKQVDPKIYAEIKDSEQWQSTIELIYDGEAIGLPLYYLSEMMSAVPPNFYAEKFSYIASTIIIEVALFVVLALLGGAGAAARLATLIARINNLANKSKKGASALKAYVAMLKAFEKSISKIKDTANKLTASRRLKTKNGATAGTITSTRKVKKKPKKCKTKDHKKIKKGTIEYI